VGDIDTAAVDSLKTLDPKRPIREATNVLIAWNGSTEQTRAIAFAMPLLQRAESVKVLTIPGGAGVPGPSGEQVTRCLKRNGVVATPLTVELDGRSTGETILATATLQDSDLLIKGAYTKVACGNGSSGEQPAISWPTPRCPS
jgi:hypothetical protein